MSLQGVLDLLGRAPGYRRIVKDIEANQVVRLTLLDAAKPAVLGALWRERGAPTLVVCPRPEDARRLHEQLLVYCGDDAPIYHFAEVEVLPYERLVTDLATTHLRLRALAALVGGSQSPGPLVVTSVQGLLQKTIQRPLLTSLSHTLRVGERIQLEPLLHRWITMGYALEPAVEVPGTASRRGGILDIYPPNAATPLRIELWGDRIESIRRFEPGSQRSEEQVESVAVIPAQEVLPLLTSEDAVSRHIRGLDFSNCATAVRDRMEEELSLLLAGQAVEEAGFYAGFFNDASLLDFLGDGLLALDGPLAIEGAAQEFQERSWDLRRTKAGRGEIPGNFPPSHLSWEEAKAGLQRPPGQFHLLSWAVDDTSLTLPFAAPPSYWSRLEALVEDVRQRLREGYRVVVCSQHAQRLAEVLREGDIGAQARGALTEAPSRGAVAVVHLSASGGWVLPGDGSATLLLTDAEVFGSAKQRAPRRRAPVRREAFLAELTPGSYVVHTEHGIARFTGTTTVEQDTGGREYLVLEYAGGDKLYVPTEHLDRVAPYVAPSEDAPAVTRLGTQEWERAKERVKRSAQELAGELLALYAQREVAQGFDFSPDAPWQRELEDSFPYVETSDQLAAINAVKADMERARPMDRLVCGDVGYGKTEVALRAAFKAVMDNRQVAMLVPTTVLAQQHYATFSERLSVFPVKVEVLSRFRTRQEQQEVVQALKDGSVDIVIGTHRLLQKDVGFKDLGLVVIDEEQRFGVTHKERLKNMRREVDVLTITATPIPRTLHMSLAGIRDMSTMETPPEERLPIKTYVSEYSEELIREAILRELDRGGQVFFLHNRVHGIAAVAEGVRRLVPQAVVDIAHGRMPEESLARVMEEFAQGRVDVLVCTTIIESGLDIPRVNTLIVNRSDRFGLAQLYQLRGRIGRAAHRAYAYLLIPRGRRITETAQKRLQTILAATELGAGFRIAMKDLEIRGAGNILGPEQSGHIHAVGFDLYTRLLSEAVEELRTQRAGEGVPSAAPDIETQLELKIPAFIPPYYIGDLPTRLGVYQRLARVRQPQEAQKMAEELRDRFGAPPAEVHNLLYGVRLKALCRQARIEAVTRTDGTVVLRLAEEMGGARPALERALGPQVRVGHRQLRLHTERLSATWGQALLEVVQTLVEFRQRVALAVEEGGTPQHPMRERSGP